MPLKLNHNINNLSRQNTVDKIISELIKNNQCRLDYYTDFNKSIDKLKEKYTNGILIPDDYNNHTFISFGPLIENTKSDFSSSVYIRTNSEIMDINLLVFIYYQTPFINEVTAFKQKNFQINNGAYQFESSCRTTIHLIDKNFDEFNNFKLATTFSFLRVLSEYIHYNEKIIIV